jgi:diguanylate cyclase (GGDEF)-like protein
MSILAIRHFRRSIGAKLVLVILPTMLVGSVMMFLVFDDLVHHERMGALKARFDTFAVTQGAALTTALWSFDADTIDRVFRSYADVPELMSAELYDIKNNQKAAVVGSGAAGQQVAYQTEVPLVQHSAAGDYAVGRLSLAFHDGFVRREMSEGRRAAVLILSVAFALLCAVTLAAVRHTVTLPLRRLQSSLLHHKVVDVREALEWNCRDELGDVVTAYNQLLSEINQQTRDIHRLAYHDPLTGLPNRRLLEDRLNHALTVAERQESALAVLFVDIDNFKRINDTLGHEVGDSLIKVFAERIWQSVRSMDTVARWGADDFVVVLENLGSPGEATSVGEKLIEAVGRPLHLGDNLLRIGASIGVALYPQDGKDVSTLLKNADLALFEAKNAGHDTLNFFDEEMNLRALRRLEIDAALRYGIEHGELELHYQPKVSVHDERLYGVEALVRWRRPGEGLIPPDNFIPWAEESGLIVDLGEWVLNEACQQIRRWQASGIGDIHVAVNVSPRQLRQAIQVERLIGIVEGSGVRPDLIELELTEACLMQDPDRTIEFLQTLRAQGFGIAIDDFGTGYSNLSYLRRLPVTTLKIDKSFVKDIEDDADDAEIIRTIIAMAKALGLGLVAEGVETPGQLAFLRDSACHVVQGYHFAKPMGPAAFAEWLIRFEAERRPSPNHEATQRLAPAYFMG